MTGQLQVRLASLRRGLAAIEAAFARGSMTGARASGVVTPPSPSLSSPSSPPPLPARSSASTVSAPAGPAVSDPQTRRFTLADAPAAAGLAAWLLADPCVPSTSLTYCREAASGDALPAQAVRFVARACAKADTETDTGEVIALPSTLLEKERLVANAIAAQLGLPPRFHWPGCALPSRDVSHTAAGARRRAKDSATLAPRPAPASANLFLWGTAVRTTDGAHALPLAPGVAAHAPPPVADPDAVFRLDVSADSRKGGGPPAPRVGSSSSPRVGLAAPVGTVPGQGGGVLHSSRLESYLCLLHTARTQALSRAHAATGGFTTPSAAELHRQAQRLVVYGSDQADPELWVVARLLGVGHVRVLQTVPMHMETGPKEGVPPPPSGTSAVSTMYAMSVPELKRRVVEDVAAGLFPSLVVGVFGSALSSAVDPLVELAAFCRKVGVWFHVDASHGSAALLADPPRGRGGGATSEEDRATGAGADPAALHALRARLVHELRTAAVSVDSLLCSVTSESTGLPFAPLPALAHGCGLGGGSPLSLLFLAHTAKLQRALHMLDAAKHTSANYALTPTPVTTAPDSSLLTGAARDALGAGAYLRLIGEGDDVGRASAISAAVTALLMDAPADARASVTCAADVQRHQLLLHQVQAALHGDGRLDCVLTAGPVFGRLYVRLLTQSDEVTAALAARIAARVQETEASGPPVARLYVSVVVLQRRAWLCLSVGRVGTSTASSTVVAYVVDTVKHATSAVLSGL